MRTNAIELANHFVLLSQREKKPLRLMRLLFLVYATHGFSLAIDRRALLDSRWDRVMAWDAGPIVPSVLYSFQHYGNRVITEPSIDYRDETENEDGECETYTPELRYTETKNLAEAVWKRYAGRSDEQLLWLWKHIGSPWEVCWNMAGKYKEIPDEVIALYFDKVLYGR